MSNHVRKQIRDITVNELTGLPTTGDEVFPGRTRILRKNHSPTWLVYSIDETAEVEAMGGKQRRVLTLRIDGRVQIADGDPEDTLDQMAAEAEEKLLKSGALLSIARSVELSKTQMTLLAQGEMITAGVALDFAIEYRTAEGAPTVSI